MNSSGQQPGYGPPSYPHYEHRPGAGYGPGPDQPHPYPQHPPGPPQPPPAWRTIPAMTTAEVPGQQITGVIGDVVGVVTRRHTHPAALGRAAAADAGFESALTSSRQEAVRRMTAMAHDAGAHAVVGLRFDSGDVGPGVSEVVAYGTAVVLAGPPDAETGRAEAASAPEDDGSQPATDWRPRQGSRPLLGDRERARRHAAGSPALPGNPQPDV